MKTFNSLEEMKPYYNKNTNTYDFYENGLKIDVEFKFNLNVESHITAWNINALDITAWNINALDITARNIHAGDINARDITAWDITAWDINAGNINAWNITACDITACDITAGNITAWDINAGNITAMDISYCAVCFAHQNIKCTSIKGEHQNAKHFVLDGKITIVPKQEKETVTLEVTDEQLAKIKSILEENK